MSRLLCSIMTLLTSLHTLNVTPIAYAQPESKALQTDSAGAGCLGCSDNKTQRSSGLSEPACVGAGCMGN
ncbi:MAG TPA: hypothetical protein VHD33_01870 [Legionellaceae bacterium]|nr:hypothetical protein [Legionellaceae bacterium]